MAVRSIWFLVAVLALALGALGVFLPLLPTTPFILLAAYGFARSSRRMHAWLVGHRLFGPAIANWNRYGAIDRRAKVLGVASLAAVLILSVAFGVPIHAIWVQAAVLSACAIFILSRPVPPERRRG
ncbi:YbaN family protein [Hyphobacterium marinum]|uniref:YbaN family protein n=1 Tax=Hyphobacterium marinum TaxID=3116574 RepID=A0ABU7LU89_9PROT|nr:YbaN family protein [Hyphobacterium sp. Y6023]MEE2565104.1 YbaN family protein [Hyphobacterium sp. Y6023]